MARRWFAPLALAGAGLFAGGTAHALGQSADVKVVVRLAQKCLNAVLSQSANALVEVACTNGDFVQIEPAPGRPFLGTHGSAFRFSFAGGASAAGALIATADPYLGGGTITSLRIYNIQGEGSPLEMLVTF